MILGVIKWFFAPFKWLPWHYGVEGTHGEAKYFSSEGLLAFAAVMFWILPAFLGVIGAAIGVATLFFGFEPKGSVGPNQYSVMLVVVVAFPALLTQSLRILMLRKVSEEQIASMEQWHKILPDLPKPSTEMTKKDLAVYVDAIYKKERKRQLECEKKSLLD